VCVACAGADSVFTVRTDDWTVVGTVGVGAEPYGICVLPSGDRLYVTNSGDGTVSVIE